MRTDDSRCTRCGLPASALIHTGNHPTNCHPFEAAGQCANCGHNTDMHDFDTDERCRVGGYRQRCNCTGFEAS